MRNLESKIFTSPELTDGESGIRFLGAIAYKIDDFGWKGIQEISLNEGEKEIVENDIGAGVLPEVLQEASKRYDGQGLIYILEKEVPEWKEYFQEKDFQEEKEESIK